METDPKTGVFAQAFKDLRGAESEIKRLKEEFGSMSGEQRIQVQKSCANALYGLEDRLKQTASKLKDERAKKLITESLFSDSSWKNLLEVRTYCAHVKNKTGSGSLIILNVDYLYEETSVAAIIQENGIFNADFLKKSPPTPPKIGEICDSAAKLVRSRLVRAMAQETKKNSGR